MMTAVTRAIQSIARFSFCFLIIAPSCWSYGLAQIGSIEKHDDRLDELISPRAQVEILADGFEWTEGPLWIHDGGYLLFSDIPANTVYRWDERNGLTPYLRPSGYMWSDPPGNELGANGLALDPDGRLVICDHGNRQVARLDTATFTRETIAAEYEGKRLNSPNDLVFRSNGDLYFTDPPFGLEGLNQSPDKELSFNGVYRVSPIGAISLLTDDLTYPNGIALSPDESVLYVTNSDPNRPIIMAYDVRPDGGIENGRVFFDASELIAQGGSGVPDGMTVDQHGNLFASGPGGILVLSPTGDHLGTISTGRPVANCAFGDDGSMLYITSQDVLARVHVRTSGF